MRPLAHFLLGSVFSYIVYLIFPLLGLKTLIILASTVLIDIDHYIIEVMLTGKFSIPHAYHYYIEALENKKIFNKRKLNYELYIFHSIEFYLLLLVLSFSYEVALLILGGVSFHIFLDCFNPVRKEKMSIIHYHLSKSMKNAKTRNRKKKK